MSGKNLRKTKIKAGNPAAVALLLAFGCAAIIRIIGILSLFF